VASLDPADEHHSVAVTNREAQSEARTVTIHVTSPQLHLPLPIVTALTIMLPTALSALLRLCCSWLQPLLLFSLLTALLLSTVTVPQALAQTAAESALLDVTSVLGGSDGGADLLMGDLSQAYILQSANTSLTINSYTPSSSLFTALAVEELDFAAFSAGLTDLQAAAFPNLQLYPFTCYALVPIYHLDALGSNAPPVVLDRPTLAAIYAGEITWWNDSRLQADNTALVLPEQQITMVLPSAGDATNTVWTTALNKFYPGLNSTIPVSSSPAWPLSLYYSSLTGVGLSGQASLVVANDGSIGFTYQPVALELKVDVAYMINKAGIVVQPSALSVTFAADELGTQVRSRTTQGMDLTDGSGASDWPITMMSFLLIDTQYSRSTCHFRQAVVNFWLWFYTSSVAAGLMANRAYAPVPFIVLTQLDVVNHLQVEVMCRGSAALPATATTTRIMGAPSVSFLSSLFASLYLAVQSDIEWTVQSETDQVTLQQLVDAEIDLAFVNPNNVDAALLQAVIDSPDFLLLPTYLTAPVFAYNPQLTDTVSIAAYTLTLDLGTIGKIMYYCINNWNDPVILQQNPWLKPLLPPVNETLVPISKIVGCGSSVETAPNTYDLLETINSYPADSGDDSLLACQADLPSIITAAFATCQSVPQYQAIYTTAEDSIPALVLGIKGSIGTTQANGNSALGIITITDVRNGVRANTTASVVGMSACASDSFDGTKLTTGLSLELSAGSDNPQCYRATQQVVAILRTGYYSTANDASGCDRGFDTLQFLQWFYTTPLIDQVVNSVDSVRVSSLSSDILNQYLNALYGVTCDTETLLVTQPDAWVLSSGIAGFVNAMSALGLIGCGLLCLIVFHYRHNPVMRSASPPFLYLSIAGVGLMFTSGFFLVATVADSTCSVFSWLLNFGLMLCFSPLFAKTWRIYRIFGR
jgi:phosphate transport system substrate-binding protein